MVVCVVVASHRSRRDVTWWFLVWRVATQSIVVRVRVSVVVVQHGGAVGGYDMRVIEAWRMGFSGKGVSISILDDGIQPDHADLARNYVSSLALCLCC